MAELQLKLSEFEGPLDLLLHLIKTSKLDIYDIPIAQITDQYLHFLENMTVLKLDIAGDYLVMASTLLAIKSKLLLPHHDFEPEPEMIEDPREQLVQQLLAYQAYQEVSQELRQRENEQRRYFAKSATVMINTATPQPLPKGLVSLSDLMVAMQRVQQRQGHESSANRVVTLDEYTVESVKLDLIKLLKFQPHPYDFWELCGIHPDKEQVIVTFLALLDLMKHQKVQCYQQERNKIIVVPKFGKEE